MSKRLNMSNDEAVEWLLSLKNLDICGENRKTAIDKAVTALKAQSCIEDYPTCTECEHYDSEKHYCPRFCQVIKDTLAEAENEEVIRVSKGVLKARTGRFVIYDAEWLKEHFYETEEKIYGQPKQPCEDCISREAIKQGLQEHRNFYVNAYGGFSNLSQNDKSRVDEIDNCIAMVVNEPSVTPQRPKGKWKRIAGFEDCNYDKCSVCGAYQLFYYGKPSTNYCPNCGAEMSGGDEDEDGKSL